MTVSTSTTATWAPKGNVGVDALKSDTPDSGTRDRSARASQSTERLGVPATWNAPPSGSNTTSSAAASSSSATSWRAASTSLCEASATAAPASCTDREPTVSPPTGTRSVSPCTTSTSSMATPMRSATIIDHTVS